MKTLLICVVMGMVVSSMLSVVWAAERGGARERPSEKPEGKWEWTPEAPENVEVIKKVIYGKGGGRDLGLALFLPKDDEPLHPGIVFIHGGGWTGGSPAHFSQQAAYLAGKGYVGACVEYRLSGEAKFPAAVEDVKCAVRWMRANAEKYKIDPERIASVGGSAGGHLASILGVMDKADGLEGDGGHGGYSSKTNAVVAFNGAFSFMVLQEHMQNISKQRSQPSAPERFIGGTIKELPEKFKQASPMTYVDETDAPHLFLHGTADGLVPIRQSVDMMKALEKVGVRAELYAAEGEGHGFFNKGPQYEKTLKRMEQFLNDVFEWGAKEKPTAAE
jgi:acetyl esterase/lipase